jgi:hypothetical protein
MIFVRRRRPLATAAMIGGTAYVAHKSGQRQAEAAAMEADQDARLAQLEAQQMQAAAPPPAAAPAPAAPAAGGDITSQLAQLAQLKDSGALSQEEFDAAKAKALAGG